MSGKGALFSDCRRYRYALWRIWTTNKAPLVVIGLNPSTADEAANDPTIARLLNRATLLDAGGLIMLNLYAWRSPDPRELGRTSWPVQPQGTGENDEMISQVAQSTGRVLCGWGNNAEPDRAHVVVRMLLDLDVELLALKLTAEGQPQHPLYLPYALTPKRWFPVL